MTLGVLTFTTHEFLWRICHLFGVYDAFSANQRAVFSYQSRLAPDGKFLRETFYQPARICVLKGDICKNAKKIED